MSEAEKPIRLFQVPNFSPPHSRARKEAQNGDIERIARLIDSVQLFVGEAAGKA